MNRGLRPVLDSLESDGCPICGKLPDAISVNGPSEIILHGCGHVIDAKAWADAQHNQANSSSPD